MSSSRRRPGVDADVAFVSRDVTGLSTKHAVLPETQVFYDAMLGAPSLRWVHLHSAGADRPVYRRAARGAASRSTHLVRRQRRGRGADCAGRPARARPAPSAADGRAARAPVGAADRQRPAARPGRPDRRDRRLGPDRPAARRAAGAAGAAARRGAQQRRTRGPGHRDRGLREPGAGAAARRLAGAGLPAQRAHARRWSTPRRWLRCRRAHGSSTWRAASASTRPR